MRKRLKLGLIATAAVSAAFPLLQTQSAYADYAPSKGDVVGVGSDTLQYIGDFLADGDAFADPGYNANLNKFRLISFDAIPDANARLAYGVNGGQSTQTACTPGTGSTAGTGNATGTNAGVPCVLNPTIYLRAGTQAVLRPNGSGKGIGALEQDILAGNNLTSGAHQEIINFSRASAAQTPNAKYGLDSIEVATDTLPIIAASATNAPAALTTAQLATIYSASTPNCVHWNTNGITGTGSDQIIPVVPQVGSGTRSFFQSQLGISSFGNCAQVAEENDPEAIGQQATPADAIEPMSLGRLNLFNSTATNGSKYFLDPSCVYDANTTACGTGSITQNRTTVDASENNVSITALGGTLNVASSSGFSTTGSIQVETTIGNAILNYTGTNTTSTPNTFTGVTVASTGGGVTTGNLLTGNQVAQSTNTYVANGLTPPVQVLTGTGTFNPTRPLYIYFRDSDIYSSAPFQPGTTVNWLETLFYDPCLTGQTCVSGPAGANEYGPAGPPFIDQAAGQQLLTDAGVTPLDTGVAANFTKGGA